MDPNTKSKSQLNIISVAFSAHNPIHNPFIIDGIPSDGTVYKGQSPELITYPTRKPFDTTTPPNSKI